MSDAWIQKLVDEARHDVNAAWDNAARIRRHNHRRVLAAFRQARVSEFHLSGTTGYGYSDPAREALEAIYASIFQTEAALVRPQIVSGTHAIWLCLAGVCRPGDEILSATGAPYDTLQRIILGPGRSLADWGVFYRQQELTETGEIDVEGLIKSISPRTRMVLFQRSRGYSLRPALRAEAIGSAAAAVKANAPHVICFVDNCYGEFVEEIEPTHLGVDLLAGSLIKNPGGTLAPSGGYVVGREEYVACVADAVTAPGLGAKVGPMLGVGRLLLQGIYMAPLLVCEAICGAILGARVAEMLGFSVDPTWDGPRSDTVQTISLGSAEAVLQFCRGVQATSPIDSSAAPTPGDLPGYTDPVVMAAGTFVQGASSELSADAPLRPPYAVFMQGAICRDQVEEAMVQSFGNLARAGLLPATVGPGLLGS